MSLLLPPKWGFLKRFRPSLGVFWRYLDRMGKEQPENLSTLSRPALAAEVVSLRQQMALVRSEAVKSQLIAATRLDVIRLLGFIANRDPTPDPMIVAPQSPEVRKIMAMELQGLAKHLRERAIEMERVAEKLTAEDSSQESS